MAETRGVIEAKNEAAVRIGAAAVLSLDGPSVAVTFGEVAKLLSPTDAARWGHALLREAGRAEGFALMAGGMEANRLAGRTIERALDWAVHHTIGDKQ